MLTPSPVRVRCVGVNDHDDDGKSDTKTRRTAALEEKLDDAPH